MEIVNHTTKTCQIGPVSFEAIVANGEAWITQKQMAELFDLDGTVISRHVADIVSDGECEAGATIANYALVRTEGNRTVSRQVQHYSSEMVQAVGYRVRSQRGVEYRQWVTRVVRGEIVTEATSALVSNASADQTINALVRTIDAIIPTLQMIPGMMSKLDQLPVMMVKLDHLTVRSEAFSAGRCKASEMADLKRRLKDAAERSAAMGRFKSKASAWSSLRNRIKAECEWTGTGSKLELLPAAKLVFAEKTMATIERELDHDASNRQLIMFSQRKAEAKKGE